MFGSGLACRALAARSLFSVLCSLFSAALRSALSDNISFREKSYATEPSALY